MAILYSILSKSKEAERLLEVQKYLLQQGLDCITNCSTKATYHNRKQRKCKVRCKCKETNTKAAYRYGIRYDRVVEVNLNGSQRFKTIFYLDFINTF